MTGVKAATKNAQIAYHHGYNHALHLLTLCGTGTPARPDTVIDAVVGQEVQFPVDNPCEDRYEVTFQILSPFVAQLASTGTDTPETRHPVYADRLHWDASGSLVLSNVQVNDSERYELQIDCYSTKRTEPREKSFDLHVFESVSKPVITANGCSSSPNVNLSCSVSNGTNVTFRWEIFTLSKGLNGTYHGPELVINHVREQELYTFRCTAKNRISNASRQQTITELCYGNDYAHQKLHSLLAAATLPLFWGLIIFICCKIKQVICEKGNNNNNSSLQQ